MNVVGVVDAHGFEKYLKGKGKWFINGLANRVTLDSEKAEETVEIRVLSSE